MPALRTGRTSFWATRSDRPSDRQPSPIHALPLRDRLRLRCLTTDALPATLRQDLGLVQFRRRVHVSSAAGTASVRHMEVTDH